MADVKRALHEQNRPASVPLETLLPLPADNFKKKVAKALFIVYIFTAVLTVKEVTFVCLLRIK